ncbi:MAG: type I-U CRISPR-associated helicase/endonuclease Cas3 [Vulcanimicrobiota bacterium]
MSNLSESDFRAFMEEVHGFQPFPWQERLLKTVLAEDRWPADISLPTASGKTACIDVAVFALAMGQPDAPRRIFFVVDRRVVVDEAYEHAKKLVTALKNPQSDVVRRVREHLLESAGADRFGEDLVSPLEAFQLRGGIYRDNGWAKNPTQPLVVCSTVDQLGSRLFFRGYGVSRAASVYHAGLVGNDILVILDEAHCSEPFRQTLNWVKSFRGQAKKTVGRPFQLTTMTATPSTNRRLFQLDEQDHRDPTLGPRLSAAKPSRLEFAEKVKGKRWHEQLAQFLVDEAVKLQRSGPLDTVAILVNRVATARSAERRLREAGKQTLLLTGRMRELDREELYRQHRARIAATPGRAREQADPLFVVATQCIEVGANLDFDGLVTECASLDALRQRFGRLNRLGVSASAPGVVVAGPQHVEAKEPDAIYGEALTNTWNWLRSVAVDGFVDFGVDSLDKLAKPEGLSKAASDAPILMPSHLDCLVQTNPRPAPDVDPSVFLRGTDAGLPEVRFVCREDLSQLNAEGQPFDIPQSVFRETLSLVPPAVAETFPVPLHVAKSWLAKKSEPDLTSDIESGEAAEETSPDLSGLRTLVWRGPDDPTTGYVALQRPRSAGAEAYLRPGDTVVVTKDQLSRLGEIVDIPVKVALDRGDEAQQRTRRRGVLRIRPGRELPGVHPETWSEFFAAFEATEVELLDPETVEAAVDTLRSHVAEDNWLARVLDAAQKPSRSEKARKPYAEEPARSKGAEVIEKLQRCPDGKGWVLVCKLDSKRPSDDFTHEDESSNQGDREVPLREHCDNVANTAAGWAQLATLAPELVSDLQLAGELHDLGKADSRFQAWLRGGSVSLNDDLLAKSQRFQTKAQRDLARRWAGYPKGKRHEFLSATLSESRPDLLRQAHDPDLVLHLVAVHHGQARPLADTVPEGKTVGQVNLDYLGVELDGTADSALPSLQSGHLDRFWRCVRRYGWWGLAYLESLIVCADHRCSEPGGWQAPPLELKSSAQPRVTSASPAHCLKLAGLDGGNLLGFLAAIGVLRTLNRCLDTQVRLSWEAQACWSPVLHLPEEMSEMELVNLLHQNLSKSRWPAPMDSLDDSNKIELGTYRDCAREAVKHWLEMGDRDWADWLTALGCEAARQGEMVQDTAFRTMSGVGHQHFLKTMRDLQTLTEPEHLRHALFEPWGYQDDKPSLRFDPADDRRYALRWTEPSRDPIRTVRGANRLAVEALPLFATVPTVRQMQTLGFEGKGSRNTYFRWPIWLAPLTEDSVRSLVSHCDWLLSKRVDLDEIGVAEVMRSQRITVLKVRNFTPAQAIAGPRSKELRLLKR